MSPIRALILLLLTSTLVFAQGTRTWEQSKFDDLTKGTAKGVAIRSTGGLELAPAMKPVFVTPSTYIWSIAADASGTIFAATGAPARIYRITPDGNATIIFEPKELQVQAILAAKSGILYAATAPDGKVYKIERKAGASASAASDAKPDAKSDTKGDKQDAKLPVDANWAASVFFDPGTRYIWDLALDASGNLFVATGDGGEIFKVTPSGAHSSFFKSDETHIRKLAFDNKGNLIAGSDGSGLIYRIAPSGEAFVLYSASKKEITALAVDKDGAIYAAGVGEKHATAATPGTGFTGAFGGPGAASPGMSTAQGSQPGLTIGGATSPLPGAQFPFPGLAAGGGSEIYRIATDGSPLKVWSSREDIVYALAFDQHGRLLVGTGNHGHVFALDGSGETGYDDKYSDLLKATATQVTAFAQAPSGGLYAATSNLGKLFLLSAAPENEGTYESDIFDAHNFSRFGRIEARSKGNIELLARSGNVDNPDRNWSAWKHLNASAEIDAPPARFLQWKAVLHSGTQPPVLESVLVNYLPKNLAPQIDDISIQLGVRYQPLPKAVNTDINLNSNPGQPRFEPPPPTVRDPDSVGVKWTAHDDNDDQLTYKLYYRGDAESRWLLLKDNLTDKFYSFDASLLPDDGYTFKVVASDAPSHSPGDSHSVEKESLRVEIDTTPPNIENLAASEGNGELHITFSAVDKFSPIKRAEYSIDAGDWQFIEPVSGLSDAKTETYDFRVSLANATPSAAMSGKASAKKPALNDGPIEHVVVVRAYDRYDNLGTAKYVVRGK